MKRVSSFQLPVARRRCLDKSSPSAARRAGFGYTFIELMVSLTIFSVIASAATALMFSSYNTNRYVRTENDTVQQVETALRRMIDNVRSASTLGPSFSSTTLDVMTQADPDHALVKYEVTYAVNNQGQLVETHDLYGSNVLASNVSAFSVTTLQASKPTMLQLTLTAQQPGGSTVTRTCNVTSRNF